MYFGIGKEIEVSYDNHQYVLIDTSVYESNNFFEGKKILELLRLSSESYITILLPEIVKQEILKHINDKVESSIRSLKKARNDIRVIRNYSNYSDELFDLNKEAVTADIINKFEELLVFSKVVLIKNGVTDISNIFADYFSGKHPFGPGKKKSEFPDAFILQSANDWCKQNGCKAIVLSNDGDLQNADYSNLTANVQYESYLEDKIKDIDRYLTGNEERIVDFLSAINQVGNHLNSDIKEWVISQLDDSSKYYNFYDNVDVHEVKINRVDVETNQNDFYIIKASEDSIEAELNYKISFSIDLTIDDYDTLTKDQDSKTWFFYDTTTVELVRDIEIPVQVAYSFHDIFELVDYPEILSINDGDILEFD